MDFTKGRQAREDYGSQKRPQTVQKTLISSISQNPLYADRSAPPNSRFVGIRKSISASEVDAAFQTIASAIAQRHADTTNLVLLGIANGGIATCARLASALADKMGRPVPTGVLSVLFQRDDLGLNPIPKSAPDTEIPVDLDKATVILVDDVLFSGRTVRAALEEVFSHGRPTRVELAVLVDRGNRRLPIAADFVGFTEKTTRDEDVKVALDPANPSADCVTISTPA